MSRKAFASFESSVASVFLVPILVSLSLANLLALKFISLPQLAAILVRLRLFCPFHRVADPHRLALISDVAARITHGQGRCLGRSLLLYWLLGSNKDEVSMLIGITKESRLLESHAWVEWRGEVVGDNPQAVDRFSRILTIS
jgi:hypothetical protein